MALVLCLLSSVILRLKMQEKQVSHATIVLKTNTVETLGTAARFHGEKKQFTYHLSLLRLQCLFERCPWLQIQDQRPLQPW